MEAKDEREKEPPQVLRWLVGAPWLGPTMTVLITITLAVGLVHLGRDPNPNLFEKDHPLRNGEHQIDRLFTGTGEMALVVIIPDHDAVLSDKTVRLLERLGSRIETATLLRPIDEQRLRDVAVAWPGRRAAFEEIYADGVDRADWHALRTLAESLGGADRLLVQEIALRARPVRRVRSLANTEDIQAEADLLVVGKLINRDSSGNAKLETLSSRVRSNPLLLGSLLSEDGKALAIQVEYEIPGESGFLLAEAHAALKQWTAAEGAQVIASYGGTPVVMAEVGQAMRRDNEQLIPIVSLVLAVVLFGCLRSFGGTLLTLGVAALTVAWTLGLMGWMSVPVNVITNAMPVVLISVAVADAIHFISRVRENRARCNPREATSRALADLWRPMLLTSVTTAVGFATIAFTELDYVRHFGFFVAIGTVFAFVISILLLPGALITWPRIGGLARSEATWNAEFAISIVRVLARSNTLILLMAGTISIAAFVVGTGVKPGFSNIRSFAEDTELRVHHDRITRHFSSVIPVDFWIRSTQPRGLIDPPAMRFMADLEDHLRQHSEVGFVAGPPSFVKRIHQVLVPGAEFTLPQPLTQATLAQYLLLYESSSGQELRDYLDTDYKNGRVLALANTDSATAWRDVIDDVMDYAKLNAPRGVSVEPANYGYLSREILVEIIGGQIASLVGSIAAIGFVISVFFRSVATGVIAIAPIILTLALNFAWMSLIGAPLDVGTAMVAAITFGVGVDYSIHLLSAVREAPDDLTSKCKIALKQTIRPIAFNTLAVASGFAVLMFASFYPLQHLGRFVAATLTFSALVAVIVVPLLVLRIGPHSLRSR